MQNPISDDRIKTENPAEKIYSILGDAKLARFMVGEVMDNYFAESDDEFAGSQEDMERLRVGYTYAWTRMNIVADYIVRVVEELKALEASVQDE